MYRCIRMSLSTAFRKDFKSIDFEEQAYRHPVSIAVKVDQVYSWQGLCSNGMALASDIHGVG